MTDNQQPTANSQKPKAKEPTAAEVYHELVHTGITGWDEKKIIAHRKKCAEALAAKQSQGGA